MTSMTIVDPSVKPGLTAFQASAEDQAEVHELILKTARWLHSKGSTQWGKLLKGEDDHNLGGAIARGEVVIFRTSVDHRLAGAVILQQQPSAWDSRMWGLEETDSEEGTSVYLHRLVVDRDNSGKGLGRELMQWIEQGIRFAGKDRIRLDCIAGNDKLSGFYKQCGYTYMGETNGYNTFEKMLIKS
ncbi:GNAT family N-acetyltransferase [Paenibacillus polymyxa]|uniref:GNAT family N-acetyltransferase n=1 Tax=Paenibacillus polymyxa TaxID=1406 RepID=UPI0010BE9347|nr:GNAT family N-acetyltransferase [Paenibacillus polymyxa]TKH40102.1 GNAT family N-acetyltransferase [Paenibacillus polymyxa]